VAELEAAARVAGRPGPVLTALARLYLDPRVRRPADALRAARASARMEPWREEAYWLQARAHEALGDQAAARRALAALLGDFPSGRYAAEARRELDGLERSHYEVVLEFRFENRGDRPAERIHFQVQAAQDFPPYTQARLLEVPDDAVARQLADGTRYFSLSPFRLAPRDSRAVRLRYAVAVSAGSYGASESPPAPDGPDRFLEASRFIESDAPEIRSLAGALATSGTERERARRLYDFVVRRLDYVVQRETVGALGALANPAQADCTEFAALFVALSRAAGIPARPVFGYLHDPARETYEISHLWAEFWEDGLGWISVDPTNGTLEPDRYFARLESNSIPLWVPSPAFGDLAGVRVSYRSKGQGDPLFTELVATIRRIPEPAFVAAAPLEVAFAPTDSEALAPAEAELPVAPVAAVFAAALLLRVWHRRDRAA
jgi:transglutaminase-like putative cysteine protease